jgi:hypothetical protein
MVCVNKTITIHHTPPPLPYPWAWDERLIKLIKNKKKIKNNFKKCFYKKLGRLSIGGGGSKIYTPPPHRPAPQNFPGGIFPSMFLFLGG